MDPEDVSSWLRMGELSTKRGDVALARIAFESGLLVQPTHALLLNKLCEVCVLVGDEVTLEVFSRENFEFGQEERTNGRDSNELCKLKTERVVDKSAREI